MGWIWVKIAIINCEIFIAWKTTKKEFPSKSFAYDEYNELLISLYIEYTIFEATVLRLCYVFERAHSSHTLTSYIMWNRRYVGNFLMNFILFYRIYLGDHGCGAKFYFFIC